MQWPFLSASSSQGAFWGLVVGLAVGLVRMIMEFIYSTPSCGEEDRRPAVLKDLHYLYFALILCVLTAIVIVLISLCTPPIPKEKVSDVQRRPLLRAPVRFPKPSEICPFPPTVKKWHVMHVLQSSPRSSPRSPGCTVVMLPEAPRASNWVSVPMLCLELGRHHSPS